MASIGQILFNQLITEKCFIKNMILMERTLTIEESCNDGLLCH